MACSYKIDVDQWKNIEVNERPQCKYITIRIKHGGLIAVSCPVGVNLDKVISFLREKADFIESRLKRCQTDNAKRLFTPETDFKTKFHRLELSPTSPDGFVHAFVSRSRIIVTYPPTTSHLSSVVQEMCHKVIDNVLKDEAKSYLPARVDELAKRHNLKYHHVDLRNMTSRWGSCDAKGRICLNIQLMRLPDELIDHTILHELAHTVYMNHSAAFYQLLDKLLEGRLAQLRREQRRWETRY